VVTVSSVEFMAGYNHYDSSIAMGSLGLVTTTYYTFLPCFLFIFIGAPIIEKTQENESIKQILAIATAAVVGVIINLIVYLGKSVIFPKEISVAGFDFISFGWVVLSVITLYRFKVNMILWLGCSAIFGLMNYIISK
jgi:chromate transporter